MKKTIKKKHFVDFFVIYSNLVIHTIDIDRNKFTLHIIDAYFIDKISPYMYSERQREKEQKNGLMLKGV